MAQSRKRCLLATATSSAAAPTLLCNRFHIHIEADVRPARPLVDAWLSAAAQYTALKSSESNPNRKLQKALAGGSH
jgi:hypothetical protein